MLKAATHHRSAIATIRPYPGKVTAEIHGCGVDAPSRVERRAPHQEFRSQPEAISAGGEVGKETVDDGFFLYGQEVVEHCADKSVVPRSLYLAGWRGQAL